MAALTLHRVAISMRVFLIPLLHIEERAVAVVQAQILNHPLNYEFMITMGRYPRLPSTHVTFHLQLQTNARYP